MMDELQCSNSSTQAQQNRYPVEAKQIPNAVPKSGPHILNIPFEIRQDILRLLLPYTSIDARYGPVWHEGCTSLLDTCRQLRKESVTMIYSSNTFVFKINLEERPRFLMRERDPTSFGPGRTALERVRGLVVNPEPEIHLIHKLHIEIMESDSYIRVGDQWGKMVWFPEFGTGTCPTVLQERVGSLMDLIPSWWGGGIKTAKILWLVRVKTVGWKERKTILQPLRGAGVQIEEEIMREVQAREED